MNIVQILGRLGTDPETRVTPSGLKVTNLRVATNIKRQGKEETIWYRVTIWGDRFDKLLTYLKKGSAVIVIGEMGKPEIYNDKEGRPQVSLELTAEMIKFSPFGGGDRQDQQGQGTAAGNQAQGQSTYNQESSYGDFGSSQQKFGANAAPGSNYGQNESAGSRYASNAPDDDPLPF